MSIRRKHFLKLIWKLLTNPNSLILFFDSVVNNAFITLMEFCGVIPYQVSIYGRSKCSCNNHLWYDVFLERDLFINQNEQKKYNLRGEKINNYSVLLYQWVQRAHGYTIYLYIDITKARKKIYMLIGTFSYMLEFNLWEKKPLPWFSFMQGSIIFFPVGGGGPCVSLQFAVRVDVRLLFVILLCEAESEIKRKKEGSNSLSDSYKLLYHLEKKGVVPDPPP